MNQYMLHLVCITFPAVANTRYLRGKCGTLNRDCWEINIIFLLLKASWEGQTATEQQESHILTSTHEALCPTWLTSPAEANTVWFALYKKAGPTILRGKIFNLFFAPSWRIWTVSPEGFRFCKHSLESLCHLLFRRHHCQCSQNTEGAELEFQLSH